MTSLDGPTIAIILGVLALAFGLPLMKKGWSGPASDAPYFGVGAMFTIVGVFLLVYAYQGYLT